MTTTVVCAAVFAGCVTVSIILARRLHQLDQLDERAVVDALERIDRDTYTYQTRHKGQP